MGVGTFGTVSIPVHSNSSRSRKRGREGDGHRQARHTPAKKLCYLLKKSLVSWKERKHRISELDLTYLCQHVTDGHGPFLMRFQWSMGKRETK